MPKNKIILTNRVHARGRSWSLDELSGEMAGRLAALGILGGPVALVSGDVVELIAAACWLARTRVDGLVMPAERLTSTLQSSLRENGMLTADLTGGVLDPPARRLAPREGRVTLLTSGTTGEPKLVEHSWESLFTMTRVRAGKTLNWLLTYQAGTYAWFQMVTLVLFVPNQSLTVSAERSPARLVEAALENDVDAVSATPTFWRMAMLQIPQADLQQLKLQQITLGGEPVDQAILDRLKGLYPAATLTHIYASSEAGACVVVRDGKEGFPAGWLAGPGAMTTTADTPQLQIRDGYLWIRSPYAVTGQTGWLNSGDLVELREERVIILGRAENSFINVGGIKVAGHEVERILLQHPAILWCRVYRRKAPLMGELVAADVVFRSPAAAVSEAALGRFCAEYLTEPMVPRIWKFLDQIPATDNLKTKVN